MSLATKFSPAIVIKEHYDSFYDARTNQRSISDYVIVFGLPILCGVVAAWQGVRLVEAGSLIGAVSIITGFLFGLLAVVFQVRLTAANDPRYPHGGPMMRLIGELYANIGYSIVVGFALVVAIIAPLSFSRDDAPSLALQPWWSAFVIGLLVHFGINLLMCLKRAHLAFRATH